MERLVVVETDAARVHLLGTIQGLAAEAAHVARAFERTNPRVVGLGVGPEDVRALRALLDKPAGEDDFATSAYDDQLLQRLRAFGEVRVPPADLSEAIRRADALGAPVEPLDLDDRAYDDLYTTEVGMFQLLRNNRRVKRAATAPFPTESPEAFILAWDRAFTAPKPYGRIERVREEAMARRLLELARVKGETLAVVPLPRRDGVRERLQAAVRPPASR